MNALPPPVQAALGAIVQHHLMFGAEHLARHRINDAEPHLRAAIAIQPDLAVAHALFGKLLTYERPAEALAPLRRALELEPNRPEVLRPLSAALFGLERWEESWAIGRQRWDAPVRSAGDAHILRHLSARREWDGSPKSLAGARLLVVASSGYGDTFQHGRYAALLAGLGAIVVLACQPSAMSVMRSISGLAEVVSRDEPPPPHDLWTHDCWLWGLLGIRPTSVPLSEGYLKADPARVAWWRSALPPGRKVGLVWGGGTTNPADDLRSIPLPALSEVLAPILAVRDVSFVSLQVGPRAAEVSRLPGVLDAAPLLSDHSETAALISTLDLTISVETGTAHLAGALGCPVWVMLSSPTCCRWLRDREDSPWYRSARLLRQPKMGDWQAVAERIASALSNSFS